MMYLSALQFSTSTPIRLVDEINQGKKKITNTKMNKHK